MELTHGIIARYLAVFAYWLGVVGITDLILQCKLEITPNPLAAASFYQIYYSNDGGSGSLDWMPAPRLGIPTSQLAAMSTVLTALILLGIWLNWRLAGRNRNFHDRAVFVTALFVAGLALVVLALMAGSSLVFYGVIDPWRLAGWQFEDLISLYGRSAPPRLELAKQLLMCLIAPAVLLVPPLASSVRRLVQEH